MYSPISIYMWSLVLCSVFLSIKLTHLGPIVRISHDSITICTPEALRSIYDTRANVQKARQYAVWPKDSTEVNTFACINKTKHARRRRILTSAISDRAVHSAETYVIRHADRWNELLVDGGKDDWSEPRNISIWADSLVFDIFCELCFGKSFDTKEPGRNPVRSVPHDIAQFMRFTYNVSSAQE